MTYVFETIALVPEISPDANVTDYPKTLPPVHDLSGAILDFSLLSCKFCSLPFVLLKVCLHSQECPQYKELFISAPIDPGLSPGALLYCVKFSN